MYTWESKLLILKRNFFHCWTEGYWTHANYASYTYITCSKKLLKLHAKHNRIICLGMFGKHIYTNNIAICRNEAQSFKRAILFITAIMFESERAFWEAPLSSPPKGISFAAVPTITRHAVQIITVSGNAVYTNVWVLDPTS